MSEPNPPHFLLGALFGHQNNLAVLHGVLHQVGQIDSTSCGALTMQDAARFISSHDEEDQLSELCHLIEVLKRARDCFRNVICALDSCLQTLYHLSRRFSDLSDLFTTVDQEGQEFDGPGDPTQVADTMFKSLRRSLIFARIQEERLSVRKRKTK